MKSKYNIELTPVIYGESLVRILRFNYPPNNCAFVPHYHNRIELHYVINGSLELCCNDETVIINTNELSIVSPMLSHSGRSGKEGVEYYVIMFDIEALYNDNIPASRYLEPIIKRKVCFDYKTSDHQIVSIIPEIIKINEQPERHHPLETIGLLYRLLGLFQHNCINTGPAPKKEAHRMRDVLEYIDSHITDNISVLSVSERFNYNESYFCRKFKREVGCTVSQYIRTRRLEYARKLLETDKISVKHISDICGFSDSAHFTRSFEKAYGISPSKYRKIKG